ncbi:thioredoxin domain-containing protein [Candidatus Collierbacteria bacterium]|nr:thioredoxin domain-containing protein [Candidatus Collierbacteria bacterium]
MNLKSIILLIGGSLLVVGIMSLGLSRMSTDAGVRQKTEIDLTEGARWITENGETKVTVVEFSDLQCPACKAAQPISQKLKGMPGVKFVYRHFPLTVIHENAWKAAQAAEIAREMGKGWEMVDLLFYYQKDWSEAKEADNLFVLYAGELGLDKEKFLAKMEEGDTSEMVATDNLLANKLKLNGTPTFFVNGELTANTLVIQKVEQLLK